jgi:hypothetical protein
MLGGIQARAWAAKRLVTKAGGEWAKREDAKKRSRSEGRRMRGGETEGGLD